jgi:hypothetical protein
MVMSATFPGVRAKATGRPRSSAKAWILLVLPPRERPIASQLEGRLISLAVAAATHWRRGTMSRLLQIAFGRIPPVGSVNAGISDGPPLGPHTLPDVARSLLFRHPRFCRLGFASL